MGRVFQAEAIEEQTKVIILFLHPEFLSSSQRVTQLEEQIDALAKLRAPALRKISSLENVGGCCFLAIEAVEGPTLLNVLRSQRTLQAAEAVRVLQPLAEACDALCSAGLSCPHLVPHEIILEGGQGSPVGTWHLVEPKFLPLALDQPGGERVERAREPQQLARRESLPENPPLLSGRRLAVQHQHPSFATGPRAQFSLPTALCTPGPRKPAAASPRCPHGD